jgi:hypothetical protein
MWAQQISVNDRSMGGDRLATVEVVMIWTRDLGAETLIPAYEDLQAEIFYFRF